VNISPPDVNVSTQGNPSLLQTIQDVLRTSAASSAPKVEDPSNAASQVDLSHSGRLLNALSGRGDLGESLFKMMKRALEMITGKKVDSLSVDQESLSASSLTLDEADSTQVTQTGDAGTSLDAQYHSLHAQAQQLDFAASGTLKLKDGTEVSFSFALSVSRVYVEETSASLHLQGDINPQTHPDLPANLTHLGGQGWHLGLDGKGLHSLLHALEDDNDNEHKGAASSMELVPTANTTPASGDAPAMTQASPDEAPATTSATVPAPTAPASAPAANTPAPASTGLELVFSRQFRAFLSGYSIYQTTISQPLAPTINLAA
jgi:hypothetical protein